MKIKCLECNLVRYAKSGEITRAKTGVAVHCPICNHFKPHEPMGEEVPIGIDEPVVMQYIDILLQHLDIHHPHEESPLYPSECEAGIIATYYDNEKGAVRTVISVQRLQVHFENMFKESDDPVQAAKDWIDYNVINAEHGPNTLLFVYEVKHHTT